MSNRTMPSIEICEQARLSRDARFDGLFFTAVRTTGIYCRPVCPAPRPKPANIEYYPSAAAAEQAGFRPCLRCRPELAPGQGSWHRGDDVIARALALIDQGLLADAPLSALAERVHLGERQLRRLFVERLGAPPVGVHGTRRLLFAKQLLTETRLGITDVALASGFRSLRRFNHTFQQAYRMAPRDLRRQHPAAPASGLSLRLNYRPPYDFRAMLDFLRSRALPGVEMVDDHGYARLIGAADNPGWLRVSQWPARAGNDPTHALKLELHGCAPGDVQSTVHAVRRMFDLDADPAVINATLAKDPRLAPLVHTRPGLRLPSGWSGFEIAVRAVIGQQISVAAARTVCARVARRFGLAVDIEAPAGLSHLFPQPHALAEADLGGLGLTGRRMTTLRAVASHIASGHIDFNPPQDLDTWAARWTALPGIGPWTAQYIALRALGHPDAFPAEDLVLQSVLAADGERLSARQLRERAESWRPWRGYAVIHLWREAACIAAPSTGARR